MIVIDLCRRAAGFLDVVNKGHVVKSQGRLVTTERRTDHDCTGKVTGASTTSLVTTTTSSSNSASHICHARFLREVHCWAALMPAISDVDILE